MIKINRKSVRSKRYEMLVMSIISQYQDLNSSLEIIMSNIWSEIKALPRQSVGSPCDFYKLEIVNDKIEVWHLNSRSEKDRLVCEIYNDGINKELFNFL